MRSCDTWTCGSVAALLLIAALPAAAAGPAAKDVVAHYADMAQAEYSDAAAGAQALDLSVEAFLKTPDDATLAAAKDAWKASRVPYMQTEAFRFGNKVVDDFEGKVNAWPLDEGLIDYVAPAYGTTSDENPLYAANVVANEQIGIGKKKLNAKVINAKVLESLQEAGDVEANVATGYHAVEFLLWGQDLNGTGPGAGNRPATDYSRTDCTNGHCDRRAAYLKTATKLTVDDLQDIAKAWGPKGRARAEVTRKPDAGIAMIFTGLGSLAYGELAGERMKLGLILHDPEEEHDCFSDNTHNSHYYDIVGMRNVWEGSYKRANGSVFSGASLKAYSEAKAPDEAKAVTAAIDASLAKAQIMKDTADSGKMAYDQMIGENNAEGNKMVQDVIDALVAQTRSVEALVAKLGVKITVEGSDSLDNPSAVQ